MSNPLSPTPLPPFRGRGANEGPDPPLSPLAGEGRLARSASGERGRKDVLRGRAKKMRSEPTPAEHRLWQILRAKRLSGQKFKRQVPLDGYIVDFACLKERLIVEADGGQHSESDRDARRDAYLKAKGFRILRFWNNDIFNNEEGVLTSILDALQTPHPARALRESPSPSRAEGTGAINA